MNKLDKNFEDLMKTQKLSSPSDRFSINVMDKIYQLSSKTIYKPVIGKWGWISIAAIFVAFIALSFFGGEVGAESGSSVIMDKIASLLPEKKPQFSGFPEINTGIIPFLKQMPSVFYLSIIGISVLVLLDKFILRRQKSE